MRDRLGGRRLRVLDAFSGSGIVARMLKRHASELVVNDIEDYARVLSECYLTNAPDRPALDALVADLNARAGSAPGGFLARMYAPADDENIRPDERVFYTAENARRLDWYCREIARLDQPVRSLLLGPLLSAASVHANTAGLFKGFYKDRASGVGRFGGTGQDALLRIKGKIMIRTPVLSAFDTVYEVRQADANKLAADVTDLDLAYLDPPYNQHPYGSNYFMLNLLVNYDEPSEVSAVSGIPAGWRRSGYNVRRRSAQLMADLVQRLDAKFLLVSFNDEGFIAPDEMTRILSDVGTVTERRTQHLAFRGSRNLSARGIHVTEHLYLVEKR